MQGETSPGGDLIFADLSVPVPSRAGSLFTYSVPERLAVECGNLVVAPLSSRTVTGIVVRTHHHPPAMPARPLLGAVADAPALTADRLEVALWLANRYRASIYDALSLFMPPAWERAVVARPDDGGCVERWVFRWPVPPVGEHDVVALAPGWDEHAPTSGTSVRSRVIALLGEDGPSPAGMVAHQGRCALSTVQRMVSEGLLVKVGASEPANHVETETSGQLQRLLNDSQAAAVAPVTSSIESGVHRVFLLHGITGSGKTHVYMRLIETLVRLGRRAIVLVSEIAQTPEALERYADRFPGQVALMHSHLSIAQRTEMWREVSRGRYDVVIGPRSALFAPVPNLGLVVLDEEHEPAYKQEAPAPRYHARDVAIELGRRMKIPVVLGSATPDVSSYYLAEQGLYQLLSLPSRYTGPRESGWSAGRMPEAEVVDLREELRAGNTSILSRSLQAALERTIQDEEQSILFLNRRGSATCVLCRDCGHVVKCRRCDVPMVYHKDAEQLVCHQCNRRAAPPTRCPQCKKSRIGFFGAGTERVEAEVKRLFPSARVLRWDHDVTARRGSHALLHQQFRDHKADILVGTQMVAKALDFPRVTLVGVVLADVTLHLPDFRSAERTFQLLAQVTGRAGRGASAGNAIIQTYSPDHFSIVAAASHDYQAFYRQELEFRRYHSYPPFRSLARLLFTGSGEIRARFEAIQMNKRLREKADEMGIADLAILGPAPAFHSRVRGRFRWQIVLAGEGIRTILPAIDIPLGWSVDVDPANLL